jgi:hypothetical protein
VGNFVDFCASDLNNEGLVAHRNPVRLFWHGAVLTGAVLSGALDLCHVSLAIGVGDDRCSIRWSGEPLDQADAPAHFQSKNNLYSKLDC